MPRWRGAAHRFSSPARQAAHCPQPIHGKHRDARARLDVGIGPGLLDHAGDLVAEREGQRAARA